MKEAKSHFLLIKHSGFSADLKYLSAYQSAMRLIECGLWPLWLGTRCKHMVRDGHRLLIYIAGDEERSKHVVASARVSGIEQWSTHTHERVYPLMLDGIPDKVLMLDEVNLFRRPIDIRTMLGSLSFIPANKKKWGVAMMGGMRSLSEPDYREILAACA